MKSYLSRLLLLSLLGVCPGCNSAGPNEEAANLRVVSWNVQNLFDVEWQGTEYGEYDPRPGEDGRAAWTEQGFRYRLVHLAKVIDRLDSDILVLIEVESREALSKLNLQLRRPFLHSLLLPQPDQAINIGLLSRVAVRRSLRHEVGFLPRSTRQLRAIIEVHLENGLVLFLNHWKSQRQGFLRTLPQRQQAAAVLAERLARLEEKYVLVMGDFNEPADSYFRYSDSSFWPDSSGSVDSLINPWFAYAQLTFPPGVSEAPILTRQDWEEMKEEVVPGRLPTSRGSYYFRGEWQAIDSIFFSPAFLPEPGAGENAGGWRFAGFSVPRFTPLLGPKGEPNAWRKERMRGLSDHLPLVLELEYSPARD
ncbi:endonuclease/exonuclease/phosphatase family protein [Candidatus Haliotispira prima]|uniref:Endonuclease/exonuclease/phosphatase family protein n=1 Tax=Candidatus Haliotispira prima TaxID=3034016 RepID=A0ABY8MEZ1_9SPIO|nr:endonuclease/exonuclease/phosphatase family protein [Candidatus Haliotispira prima]